MDAAPTAAESLVGAFAGCLISGIATNAALFDIPIDAITVDMEADIDFRGLLGHDKSVRNGFGDIRYTVTIQSPALRGEGPPGARRPSTGSPRWGTPSPSR